jgi:hypothetical protein
MARPNHPSYEFTVRPVATQPTTTQLKRQNSEDHVGSHGICRGRFMRRKCECDRGVQAWSEHLLIFHFILKARLVIDSAGLRRAGIAYLPATTILSLCIHSIP